MIDSIQWHHQMIASYVGVLVRDRREKKGMTVVELADACQYSNVSIYEIERGERLIPLHRLWILADVLGYPPESFLPPATKSKKDLRKKIKIKYSGTIAITHNIYAMNIYEISDLALTHIEDNYDEPLARFCNDFFDQKQDNFNTLAKSALNDIQDGLTVEEAVQNLVRDVIADVRALHDMTR